MLIFYGSVMLAVVGIASGAGAYSSFPVWSIRLEDQDGVALVGQPVQISLQEDELSVGFYVDDESAFDKAPRFFNTAVIVHGEDHERLSRLVTGAELRGLRPYVLMHENTDNKTVVELLAPFAGKLYGVIIPLKVLLSGTDQHPENSGSLKEALPGTEIITMAGTFPKDSAETIKESIQRAREQKIDLDVVGVDVANAGSFEDLSPLNDVLPETRFCFLHASNRLAEEYFSSKTVDIALGGLFFDFYTSLPNMRSLPQVSITGENGTLSFSAPFGYYKLDVAEHRFFPFLSSASPRSLGFRRPPTPQSPSNFDMPFQPERAVEWQAEIRARLFELVALQNPKGTYPLEIEYGEPVDRGTYLERDISFVGNEGRRVEATLTVPKGEGSFPAVVCLHGHGGNRQMVHDKTTVYRGFAAELASRGFVTLAPSLWHCTYASDQLWNLMRLVDVLESLSYVDRERIGCAGLSMGGEWTMWLTAMDKRVQAAVVSGWLCTTEGVLSIHNCPCWMTPGLLTLCDIAEVHILIAPRPLLFESAIADECFPIFCVRQAYQKVVSGFNAFNAAERVRQHRFPGGHAWSGAMAYRFLEEALKKQR